MWHCNNTWLIGISLCSVVLLWHFVACMSLIVGRKVSYSVSVCLILLYFVHTFICFPLFSPILSCPVCPFVIFLPLHPPHSASFCTFGCLPLSKLNFYELLYFERNGRCTFQIRGTWWCSWLRHCATSWMVVGSIPDGVTVMFLWYNLSGLPMAVRSTHPVTEMSTLGYFLGGKGCRCVGLTTLPSSYADCLEIWKLQPPGTLRACPGLYRNCVTITLQVNMW
jgi:hypothetical protein